MIDSFSISAISNSFGFGGHNSVVAFSAFKPWLPCLVFAVYVEHGFKSIEILFSLQLWGCLFYLSPSLYKSRRPLVQFVVIVTWQLAIRLCCVELFECSSKSLVWRYTEDRMSILPYCLSKDIYHQTCI